VTYYEFLKFLHIVGVAVWLGGGITIAILSTRARASNNPDRIEGSARDIEFLGAKVFTPAAIVILVVGILMVVEADWGFDHVWVALGLVTVVVGGVLGSTVFGPQSRRMAEIVSTRGVSDAELDGVINKIRTASLAEEGLLLLSVFFMITKIGG
jgi:uncharacterized membrane protein